MKPNLLDQVPSQESTSPKRPLFLTVLCILSMAGAAFWIATRGLGIISILTAGQSPLIPAYAYTDIIIELSIMAACDLLVLTGVIMMWKLKRTGYYVYIAGQVIIAILPWIMESIPTINATLYISGVFIVLYGYNYKALVK